MFEDLHLSESLMRVIEELGFTEPTDIQAKCIPLMMEGQDVVGRSKTGSGKTFAFGIPIIEKIATEDRDIQALIVLPTRELAVQVTDELRKLTRYKSDIGIVPVYGGAGMEKQIQGIKRGKIVVGTPGRIMDHIRRRTLKLHTVKTVVLDEADEMLNMGFREDIEFILKGTLKSRQTAMFSATMPPAIKSITVNYMRDPVFVEANALQTTSAEIMQTFVRTLQSAKREAIAELFSRLNPKSAIVFCNTKRAVDNVADYLIKNGFDVEALHGDMRQSERRRVMAAMKAHTITALIATDVAARGIDIDEVEYIFNYDIPNDAEAYTHRIGRTGRAGKSGTAVSIVNTPEQMILLNDIKRELNADINEHVISETLLVFSDIAGKKMQQKANPATEKAKNIKRLPFSKGRRF